MKTDLDKRNAYSGSRYREAAMNKYLADTDIEFRTMDETDWKNYLSHVLDADDFYVHYGIEPTPELWGLVQTPTPSVIYYSIRLKNSKIMAGYIGITPEDNNLEFYVFKEHRRMHYGYRAVKAFIDLYIKGTVTGKEEAEVAASTLFDNAPAIKLLEKVGFKKEAAGFRVDLDRKEDMPSVVIGDYVCEYVYKHRN